MAFFKPMARFQLPLGKCGRDGIPGDVHVFIGTVFPSERGERSRYGIRRTEDNLFEYLDS
jgi:hypothetical protein